MAFSARTAGAARSDEEDRFLKRDGDSVGVATARSTLSFALVENAPDAIVWFDGDCVFAAPARPSGPGLDGSATSLLTISHDVTEQRRAEADRAALYQQLVAQQAIVQELMAERSREHTHPLMQAEFLSYRERHMLRLIAAGLTNREIGAEIGLAIGTVKNHVATILSKLNVTDRTQAAVRAVELGLVPTDEE